MAGKEKAPILSISKQKCSQTNKRKPLKLLKNILTSSRALHWPVIRDENEIAEIEALMKLTFCNDLEIKLTDDVKKKTFNAKLRNSIKLGVNEISRMINKDMCQTVILDAGVPSVLVMHILTTAILKKIPLICIQDLRKKIYEYTGFQSSSVCFVNSNKMCESVKGLCFKYFKNIYVSELKENDETIEEIVNDNKVVLKSTKTIETNKEEFIKLVDDPKYLKRAPRFQHLIIKRICKNENR